MVFTAVLVVFVTVVGMFALALLHALLTDHRENDPLSEMDRAALNGRERGKP